MIKLVQKITKGLIQLIGSEETVLVNPEWKVIPVSEEPAVNDGFLLSENEFMDLVPANGYFH